ncbi:MAG: SxtJ family membrane protein [Polyangiaceae bacterium]
MKAFVAEHYAPLERVATESELRLFGWIALGGFALLAVTTALTRDGLVLPAVLAAVGVVLFVGARSPIARPLYKAWMGLGLTLGLFVGPVVLTVIYVLFVAPVGLVFRLMGRDAMKRALEPEAASYWEPHPPPDAPERYWRPF